MNDNSNEPIKDTKHLFKTLNINENTLTDAQKESIRENGYLVIHPTKSILANLKKLNDEANKLIALEGDKGGWEGKEKFYEKGKYFEDGSDRLGNLVNKHEIFRTLIVMPEIIAASYEVIKSDIKVAGMNLRNPLKGSGDQGLHMDWKPRDKQSDPYEGVVCFIFLDDADLDNGPLRIIPGTHKKMGWPDEHIDIFKPHKDEKKILVKAGTVVVANLNLWHGGSDNISGKPRKMIMLNIKRRDQLQLLNYKKYLNSETKKKLNFIESYLLAVRDSDFTQKEDSVGVGKFYRSRYGNKR